LAVLGTTQFTYKLIASVDQRDLDFLIPSDRDTYIDINIKLYVRGKLVAGDGKDLKATDHTAIINNMLHSLFSQCFISLKGVAITQARELYHYRSYLETILTYGSGAASAHLTNLFRYLDDGNMLPCDPTKTEATNSKGFIARGERMKQRKEVEFYGRLHSDMCNVPRYLLPGVRLQIKFTKARPSFYLMKRIMIPNFNSDF
jgi:hypothetical protein